MTKSRKLSFLAAIALMALPMAAQELMQCKVKDLVSSPFKNKGLSLTIAKLDGYKAFAAERKHSGRARVTLLLENKGSSFLTFSPQDLGLVGKDGVQVFPIYELNFADDTVPMTLRLAPGARATVEYAMTGRLTFPAQIYLGEALLAVVAE